MITFSFRPRRWSTLPEMEALVSTRVVSWKEAADSHESMFRDTRVMPRRIGRATAGWPPSRRVFRFSSWNLKRSTCCP